MRIFGGERVQNLMDSLGLGRGYAHREQAHHQHHRERPEEAGEPATSPSVNSVLQYDDVMNQQREIIYGQRQMVLDGEDISDKLHEMMRQSIDDAWHQTT